MLLTLLLLIPVLGVFTVTTGISYELSLLNRGIKIIGLTTSIFNFFLSLIIFILFDFSSNQFQFVQEYHEISSYDFYLGLDGLSIYFVMLTTIITPIALLSNWNSINENVRSFVIIILLLETLLLAVFLAHPMLAYPPTDQEINEILTGFLDYWFLFLCIYLCIPLIFRRKIDIQLGRVSGFNGVPGAYAIWDLNDHSCSYLAVLFDDRNFYLHITAGLWNPNTNSYEDIKCLMLVDPHRGTVWNHSPNISVEQGYPLWSVIWLRIPAPKPYLYLLFLYCNIKVVNNGMPLLYSIGLPLTVTVTGTLRGIN